MSSPVVCPLSGTKGQSVDSATVKSLLALSLRQVQSTAYYFCPEPGCDVVYFSEDGQQVFRTHEIRERVYQKEPENSDVLVCYCFRYSLGDIQHEAQVNGAEDILAEINAGIQAGQCACDWRNPQGNCCLGNVRRIARHFSEHP